MSKRRKNYTPEENIVVDLEIDRLIGWKDLKAGGTRIERMINEIDWEHNVVPLTAKYCSTHFNYLWANESQFKMDKQRHFKSHKIPYNILLRKRDFLKLLEFIVLDTKRWSDVITAYDAEKTQRILESQLGIQVQVRYDEVECLQQMKCIPEISESTVLEQLFQTNNDLPTFIIYWPADWQEAYEERAAIMEIIAQGYNLPLMWQ